MAAIAQRSFAGGEISPSCYARTDQAKYATGLRTCRNFIVQRHGGIANRPGLTFIGPVKDSSKALRLLRFVLDATDVADTYLLEFGDGYIRFFQDGGVVITSGVSAWADVTVYTVGDLVTYGGVTYYCISAHTSATATDRPSTGSAWATRWYAQIGTTYEIPSPYVLADLADVQYSQKGDVITLTRRGYPMQELRRYGHTRWTMTPVAFGPSITAPTNLAANGTGAVSFNRHYAVTAVREASLEESLASIVTYAKVVDSATPVTLTWNPVPGAISYNVYRSTDGVTFGLISSAGGLPTASSDGSWTDSTETATSSDPTVWTPAAGQLQNLLASISATERAYNGRYNISFAYTIAGSVGADGLIEARYNIYYKRNTDAARVLALTSPSIFFDPSGYVGAASYGPVDVLETIEVPDDGYTTLRIEIVPEVVGPRNSGTGTLNVNAATGTVSWDAQHAGFIDVNGTPDYSLAPPTPSLAFSSPTRYPAATTNYQQRRFIAGTAADPDTIWASRIGSRASFTVSTPLQDDDMVQFALESDEAQAVKHMLDIGRLLIFTSAGVFQCGDADGVITPSTPNPRSIDSHGVGTLRPLKVADSVVFVEGRQTTVRDLQPWQAGGSLGGYSGKDLTVFASHLFDGYTIVDWAYARQPNSVIWVVRSDGVLLGLTYLREHEIWGWHRHDTDGVIENVNVVPEGSEDAVYLVVRRTINGATVRYIERMASRLFTDIRELCLVDSAQSYDGRHTGATTMILSGGTSWGSLEQLTLNASAATFALTDVSAAYFLTGAAGTLVRCTVEAYVSPTEVTIRTDRTVPDAMQLVAIGNGAGSWAKAIKRVTGLSHLEGKAVSVLGDGFVVASPNNADYPVLTVTGGIVTLPQPYAVLQIGLPYISDAEMLDLDAPTSSTIKDRKVLVNRVGLYVERARSIFAGRSDQVTAADPLAGLQEYKARENEDYDEPVALLTESIDINVPGAWNNNGRVLVRQVDPLPLIVLSVTPIGYLPT